MVGIIDVPKDLTLREYQNQAAEFMKYPDVGRNIVYPALGLCGESGEVAEKIKKIIRDKGGVITAEDRKLIAFEVSDVVWYCAALSFELGISLEDIAKMNIEKLTSRKERGVIGGSGDLR